MKNIAKADLVFVLGLLLLFSSVLIYGHKADEAATFRTVDASDFHYATVTQSGLANVGPKSDTTKPSDSEFTTEEVEYIKRNLVKLFDDNEDREGIWNDKLNQIELISRDEDMKVVQLGLLRGQMTESSYDSLVAYVTDINTKFEEKLNKPVRVALMNYETPDRIVMAVEGGKVAMTVFEKAEAANE